MKTYELRSFFGDKVRAVEDKDNININMDYIKYMYYVGEFPLGKPSGALPKSEEKTIKIYKVVFEVGENKEVGLYISKDYFDYIKDKGRREY